MKKYRCCPLVVLLAGLLSWSAWLPAQDLAQGVAEVPKTVSPERMRQVYDEVRTPFKYGLVMAPESDDRKMDCPTVYRMGKHWYMSYLVFDGKQSQDGRGYETWLAVSDDLLTWKTLGRILPFAEAGWDRNQRGGYVGLIDPEWGGSYRPRTHAGRYWMSYIGGDAKGYEQGVLKVGMAFTRKKPTQGGAWQTLPEPVLSPADPDNGWWESLTQYKSSVLHDPSRRLGQPFVMFYNAGGVNPTTRVKGERIGIALSDDMRHWQRYSGNPVLNHEGGITGDAWIQRMGDLYVMFYFSAFRPGRTELSFNHFACSYDLVHWTDWTGAPLITSSEPYDARFAHKSCVVKWKGRVYHFYCAVDEGDHRGIALATSTDMGSSRKAFPVSAERPFRPTLDLSGPWESRILEAGRNPAWQPVNVPHNWDLYGGLRRLKHGNLHQTAWYRKRFEAPSASGKRFFLLFEGVGSYATVWLNGDSVGAHRGGRTSFTLDVTASIRPGASNDVVVKAEHPAYIADLPWVCGGCSNESGFSEGSQPLGIFRPVSLYVTDPVRIQPFGVHLWCQPGGIRPDGADLQATTTLKNYGDRPRTVDVVSKLVGRFDIQAARSSKTLRLEPGQEVEVTDCCVLAKAPTLWSPEHPYLYTMVTLVKEDGRVIDELRTPWGFRTFSWPQTRKDGDSRFLVNGKPVFLNGICEYEHLNGSSHAFSPEQIRARITQIQSAGFNAFREAHQPHNLLYDRLLNEAGMLQWSQFSAHVWFDTPVFRDNFKQLLKEWVVERRNSPSILMWGLQNESSLPTDFAQECTELIRSLDPTASTERLVTTCNGGTGTDWNVIQNWSGVYGGTPDHYGEEMKKDLLNGEYGAWRTLGLHRDTALLPRDFRSEAYMCSLLGKKVRLAESVRDSICGHFLWLFNSHENPGRTQNGEGLEELDRLGPLNFKGLLTSWGEPTDAFYLYHSLYGRSPMVYIVSHSWTDRLAAPGTLDSLQVFSNCDSVALYNDWDGEPLGTRPRADLCWRQLPLRYNLLTAVGYRDGRPVARDVLVLDHLPKSPHFGKLYTEPFQRRHIGRKPVSLKAERSWQYLYRVNCGGKDYVDHEGQCWSEDRALASRTDSLHWGSWSWAQDFSGLNPFLGSLRSTRDPIVGTLDWPLFQTFRYGTDRLKYHFPVTPGIYRVELYFTEPWLGAGTDADASRQRLFDVAVNGVVRLSNLDLWQEAGHDGAVKKILEIPVEGHSLDISFPSVAAGEAVISAIAIATQASGVPVAAPSPVTVDTPVEHPLREEKEVRPDLRMEAETARFDGPVDPQAAFGERLALSVTASKPFWVEWPMKPGVAGVYNLRFRYMNFTDQPIEATVTVTDAEGRVYRNGVVRFQPGSAKWQTLVTTTETMLNAGLHTVRLSSETAAGLWLDALIVQ